MQLLKSCSKIGIPKTVWKSKRIKIRQTSLYLPFNIVRDGLYIFTVYSYDTK